MQILKSSKERGHEVNMYVPQVDSVEINLDKKVNLSHALRRDGFKSDGTATEQWNATLDNQVDNLMKRYPPFFARQVKPETVTIEDNKISWNRETLIILSRNYEEWEQFRFFLKRTVLHWAGIDLNNPNADLNYELNKALDTLIIEINNLPG